MKTLRAPAAAVLLLAGIASAPALAQSSGSTPGGSSSAAGAVMAPLNQGAPSPSGPGGAGNGGGGWWNGDGPHDRERWRKRCLKRGWCGNYGFYGGYAYGGGRYDPLIVARDLGYFNQRGNAPEAANGGVRYDYDRGYPYEHFSRGLEMSDADEGYGYERRERSCETEMVRDRRTGRDVSVRVCRN